MFRSFVSGADELVAALKAAPSGYKTSVLRDVATYLINNGLNVYPEYNYVSRQEAYGQTFFSPAQRRWFWANGGPDMIGDHRTGGQASWKATTMTSDYAVISNSASGIQYTQSVQAQAAQPRMVGWYTVIQNVMLHLSEAVSYAQANLAGKLLG